MGERQRDRVLEVAAQRRKVLEAAWKIFGSVVGEVADPDSGNPDAWPGRPDDVT